MYGSRMLGRSLFGRSATRRALGKAIMAIAVLSQLSALLIAPLGDLQHQLDHHSTAAGPTHLVAAERTADTPHAPVQHHDAATCPACIAQSIVAHLATSVAGVAVAAAVGHLDPLERVLAPRPGPTFLQYSRGPPTSS